MFSIDDFLESLDCVFELYVYPGDSGESLRHVKRLGEKALDLSRSGHRELVFFG